MTFRFRIRRGKEVYEETHKLPTKHAGQALRAAQTLVQEQNALEPRLEPRVLLSITPLAGYVEV